MNPVWSSHYQNSLIPSGEEQTAKNAAEDNTARIVRFNNLENIIMQQKYIDCFEMFDYAEKIVALTGAGISTLSGIPDFRGKNGFYTNNITFEGYDRDALMDLKFFVQHPEIFYRFALQYMYPMLEKTPSVGHITLAELQKRSILDVLPFPAREKKRRCSRENGISRAKALLGMAELLRAKNKYI